MTGMAKLAVVAALMVVAGSYPGSAMAGAAPTASSAAYGIFARFTHDGKMVTLGPLAQAQGSAPPPYSDTVAAGQVHKTLAIVADAVLTPSLSVKTALFESHVASKGLGVDSISAEADTTIKGLDLALAVNPRPPGATVEPRLPPPFLTLSATRIDSSADFTLVLPRHGSANGSASFDGLEISGSLVGNKKLKFSGDADKNKILFQSPTVTITLNQEVQIGMISCSPKCVFTGGEITTYAVDIALSHADLDGKTVSGEILVGMADAD